MSNIQKPITVQMAETLDKFAEIINSCGLPCFILESMIKDIYEQVKSTAIKEYQRDKQKYEAELAAQEPKEEPSEIWENEE